MRFFRGKAARHAAPERPPAEDLSIQGLSVVAELVRDERLQRWNDIDAVDAKAGIVLAGAGALAVLGGDGPQVLQLLGTLTALGAAAFALGALRVQPLPYPQPTAVRRELLNRPPRQARLELMDTEIAHFEELSRQVRWKSRRVRRGYWTLAAAVVILGCSNLWDPATDIIRWVAACLRTIDA